MKKSFILFVLAVVVFIGCHLYSRHAEVVDIFDGAVAMEDTDGEVWLIDDDGSFSIGDSVTMIMNNCGTKTIYDDEIVIMHRVV